jgi:hypothetical protein
MAAFCQRYVYISEIGTIFSYLYLKKPIRIQERQCIRWQKIYSIYTTKPKMEKWPEVKEDAFSKIFMKMHFLKHS